jgi:hexosaminidase
MVCPLAFPEAMHLYTMRRILTWSFLLPLCSFAQTDLIPLPALLRPDAGTLDLRCPWVVVADAALAAFTQRLQAEVGPLHPASDLNCLRATPISLRLIAPDSLLDQEWYSLKVATDGIAIAAVSEAGLYRGTRTLVQLLEQGRAAATLPCLTISDQPRFAWRGMHLDVCRHFFPVPFIKKYIDLLARYKMNSFHWHLTDDQGWRIEIKKYPKLTSVGAWRKGSQVGAYAAMTFDTVRYGGFYTQDEVREVVAYAAERHINVVPEIEMPGHAMAALTAYPQMGCTGGPYEVQRGWGVFPDVFCAGNDSVFTLLEGVLTEVMALFPSTIIHIGGDECPKERWKTCPQCQARMKAEGLKDEHELQSYFIGRIGKFMEDHGRRIIGWDEILEGGALPPNSAVMSWRGTEGGIAAARSGHDAVMSPGSHCYFDHYQGDPANEPLAIGGYTSLQKVYSYEPIPNGLNAQEAEHILGAQGNIWTEYIGTPEHVEYMAAPRLLALAEVLWTPKEKRDETGFIRRLEAEFPRLDSLHINASRSLYQVRILPRAGRENGEIVVGLASADSLLPIHYEVVPERIDPHATDPRNDVRTRDKKRYAGPFTLSSSCAVRAWATPAGPREKAGQYPVASVHFRFNKATARPLSLSTPPDEHYNAGGAFTLVDGITAQDKRVNSEWLGWKGNVTITVDLGSEQELRHIGIGAWNDDHSWIHPPADVSFSTSADSTAFTPFGQATAKPKGGRIAYAHDSLTRARYVRIAVNTIGPIPEGSPGAGNPAWLFLDELEVR